MRTHRTPHTTPPDGAAPIEVRDLRKVYAGGVEAVKGISFVVEPGEVFGLLGPNGAGKSTTIGMLTTTVAPTSGQAWLTGHDVRADPIAARRSSSVVFQDAVVDASLSGRRNLDLHARLWGVPPAAARRRAAALAETLGLHQLLDRSVSTYSGGQRRRLEIARALVSEPRVLFLDEPTVGLDPRIRHELLDVIAGLRDRDQMAILLTTHYLDEAEQLCDRIAIMHEGAIVALDTPEGLLAGLGDEVAELRVAGRADAALAVLRATGLAGADAFSVGSTVTVPLHDWSRGEAHAAVAASDVPALSLITRPPTLDDVYLRLTGAPLADVA